MTLVNHGIQRVLTGLVRTHAPQALHVASSLRSELHKFGLQAHLDFTDSLPYYYSDTYRIEQKSESSLLQVQ